MPETTFNYAGLEKPAKMKIISLWTLFCIFLIAVLTILVSYVNVEIHDARSSLADVKLQKRARRALQNDILKQKFTNDVTRTASTAAGISSTTTKTTTSGPKPAPTTAVLILTYQRSGSSLIGELFNQNPSAFYLFEPLWALYENKINPTFPSTLLLANGNKRPMPATEDFGSFSQELITNMARCDLGQVPMEILAPFGDDGHWFFSANGRHKALAKYIDCIKKDNDAKKDALCVPLAQAVCDNSTIRAIKTIRFRMWMLERVLLENPGMKVIHLFRDPRASILSRFTSTQAGCKLEFEASARCYDMSKDLTTGGHLFKKYPGRIMRILYEDMADYPVETAQKIHTFLGKELPKNVLDWVLENTAAGVNDTELFETTRANSSETAHAWELSIPTDMAFKIDEICYDVIEELGYEKFPDILNRVKDRRTSETEMLMDDIKPTTPKPPFSLDSARLEIGAPGDLNIAQIEKVLFDAKALISDRKATYLHDEQTTEHPFEVEGNHENHPTDDHHGHDVTDDPSLFGVNNAGDGLNWKDGHLGSPEGIEGYGSAEDNWEEMDDEINTEIDTDLEKIYPQKDVIDDDDKHLFNKLMSDWNEEEFLKEIDDWENGQPLEMNVPDSQKGLVDGDYEDILIKFKQKLRRL